MGQARAAREAEINPEIVSLLTEPGALSYMFEGEERKTFPDLITTYWDGFQEFVEVKDYRHRDDPELRQKYRAIAAECRARGCGFRLLFDDKLRQEPRHKNVSLIRYYRPHLVAMDDILCILMNLSAPLTLGELIERDTNITRLKIFPLVSLGYLWINLFKPIDQTSIIRKRRLNQIHYQHLPPELARLLPVQSLQIPDEPHHFRAGLGRG
jgi:hypothetical protein